MLRSCKDIIGATLAARDGEIGSCKDFLFEADTWTIRYMVADTGGWLSKRRVLISPISLGEPDWDAEHLPVRLEKREIEDAPRLDQASPVSTQYEARLSRHYGHDPYWGGAQLWGYGPFPTHLYGRTRKQMDLMRRPTSDLPRSASDGDSRLRSVDEVIGYDVVASDGDWGSVDDFVVDVQSWRMEHLVVAKRRWIPGPRVVVPSTAAKRVDWKAREIRLAMRVEELEDAPRIELDEPLERQLGDRSHGAQP